MREYLDRLRQAGLSDAMLRYVEHELVHGKLEVHGNDLVSPFKGRVMLINSAGFVEADGDYFQGV